jgi:hypothetical protein
VCKFINSTVSVCMGLFILWLLRFTAFMLVRLSQLYTIIVYASLMCGKKIKASVICKLSLYCKISGLSSFEKKKLNINIFHYWFFERLRPDILFCVIKFFVPARVWMRSVAKAFCNLVSVIGPNVLGSVETCTFCHVSLFGFE